MRTAVKGFTLIEVLIAVFIIAISLLGLAIGFSNGLAWIQVIREVSVANRIAQEKMEEIRGTDPADIPYNTEETKLDKYNVYVDSPVQIEVGLTQATVRVTWTSHSGRELSRSLATYVTEWGINK